ncbi:MAG: FUSC family protein [Hyphomicrobiales bacterium]|nr:FUSC family protein [Rhodoblastus sp.]MCC2103284.1 FUSC family protein [Hyphomicrobiales bacterium]MCC2106288.1 FUSC family protein [Hyphomicrobiales bacterium]
MPLTTKLAAEPLGALRGEFSAYPGRADFAFRIAMVCALATIVCMASGTPEAAVACYLAFFATREDAAASVAMGLKLIVGATVGIAIGLVFLMASADEPLARMCLMLAFTFAGMFFAHASSLGPVASAAGFVLALVMTLFDDVPVPELLVRGILYLWQVVAIPMALLVVVNAIAGPRAHKRLRRTVVERLEATADLLDDAAGARARARSLLEADAVQARERRKTAYLFFSGRARARARLETLLDRAYDLLAVAEAAAAQETTGIREAQARRLRALAAAVADGTETAAPHDGVSVDPLASALRRIELANSPAFDGVRTVAAKAPLLAEDAFSNPDHVRFALKTTLAAFICYAIYTGLNWFGIHTALVTCYFVALSSVGETIHKLTLRIVGCLIGAAIGVGATLTLTPHMTDIGQLALLVGAVSFGAAWISAGTQRISYMGWQIALAFFLIVLHGFGPSVDLVAARDRILGILLGNVVMSVVFTTLWPVGVDDSIARLRAAAARTLGAFLRDPARDARAIETARSQIGEARRISELRLFEAGAATQGRAADHSISAIEGLSSEIALLPELARAEWNDALPEATAGAARDFETAAADWLAAYGAAQEQGAAAPAWTASPDAVLESLAPGAPVSALLAAGRRIALYGTISRRIETLARVA